VPLDRPVAKGEEMIPNKFEVRMMDWKPFTYEELKSLAPHILIEGKWWQRAVQRLIKLWAKHNPLLFSDTRVRYEVKTFDREQIGTMILRHCDMYERRTGDRATHCILGYSEMLELKQEIYSMCVMDIEVRSGRYEYRGIRLILNPFISGGIIILGKRELQFT
jgi:hypothetical protein